MRSPALAAALFVLAGLAGCAEDEPSEYTCPDGTKVPSGGEGFDPAASCPQETVRYPLTIRVTRETVDGPTVDGAEVYLVEASRNDPSDANSQGTGKYANSNGEVDFEFEQPVELLLQVFHPDAKSWTREGMRISVGETITADEPAALENRTLIVPVMRHELPFMVNTTWGPVSAAPNPGADPAQPGNETIPAFKCVPVTLPIEEALHEDYWRRLVRANVVLQWENGGDGYGDLYTGLCWGDSVFASQEENNDLIGPGLRQAEFAGSVDLESRPSPTAPLGVAVMTNSILVGQDLPLLLYGSLVFKGEPPAEMAVPGCWEGVVELC